MERTDTTARKGSNQKISFTVKLIVGITGLSVLGFLIMFLFVNAVVRNIIYDRLVIITHRDMLVQVNEVDAWFETYSQLVRSMAIVWQEVGADPGESGFGPDPIAMRFLRDSSSIIDIYVGFEDGSNINTHAWVPPEEFHATDRPWYVAAKAAGGEVTITLPYVSWRDNEIVASMSMLVPDMRGMEAVVGLDIGLNYLFGMIARSEFAHGGDFILLGPDGEIIVHPNEGYMLSFDHYASNLRDVPGGLFMMDNIISGAEVAEFEDIVHGTSYFFNEPLSTINWTLAAVVSNEAIETQLSEYMLRIWLVLAAVLMLMIVLGGMLAYHVANKERDAEQRFKFMLDAVPLSVFLHDRDHRTIDCNMETLRMYNISNKDLFLEKDLLLMPATQPDGRDSRRMWEDAIDKTFAEGFQRFECMAEKMDGTPMPVDVHFVRINYNGDYAVVEYARDLTQLKTAMEKEREVSELNKVIIDSAPFVINLWDESGNLLSTSQHALKLHGVSSKEEYVKRFYDFSPKYQPIGTPSHKLAPIMVGKACREGFSRFEWVHCTSSGTPIHTDVSVVRFEQNGRPIMVSFTTDMSLVNTANKQKRELERKLIEQEMGDRFRLIVDSTPLIIQFWDKSLKCIDCNETTLKFYGFKTKEEYHEKLPDALPQIQEDGTPSWEKWNAFLESVLKNGKDYTDFLESDKEGNPAFFEVVGLRTKYRNEVVVLTYSTDVTEIRRTKEELGATAEKAKLANVAKSIFLANIGHEISAPISAITGMVSIGKSAMDLEKKDYAFDKIEVATYGILQVISDVLDLAKIESGSLVLAYERFDFAAMVDNIVEVAKADADKKKQTLVTNLDARTPGSLLGDDQRLTQVIMNLLTNSVKFTPEGGRITVSSTWDGDGDRGVVRVDVTDTGIGITRKQQERLFDSFEQADKRSTFRKHGGIGLGLAISKQLVELMGGNVWVSSEPGRGTTISFAVPLEVDV